MRLERVYSYFIILGNIFGYDKNVVYFEQCALITVQTIKLTHIM